MATLYALKPAFQGVLRPLTRWLAGAGVTANQVTVAAALLSIGAGGALAAWPSVPTLFWLLPLVLFVRMALNAVDGMLAREHGQASVLGMYLNEVCDVVSDAALILPFAFVAPFTPAGAVGFALTATLAEFTGVLGVAAGAGRIYAGPFGKSDRAAALGAAAVLVALGLPLPAFLAWLFPLFALLSLLTALNRVRAGMRAAPAGNGSRNAA